MGVTGQCHASAALSLGKRNGTHYSGGWVGSKGPAGRVRKFSHPPGFYPRTVQPLVTLKCGAIQKLTCGKYELILFIF
jgi:hypothetical protein